MVRNGVQGIATADAGIGAVRSDRTRRLIHGASSAVLSKGAVMVSTAISIPIAFRYLGAESFGLWMTISTTLSMLVVLDLGIANSLTNFISEAYARKDREHASVYGATAVALMVGVAAVLGVAAWAIWPSIRWAQLFHLSSASEALQAEHAVAAATAVFLVGLPAGLAPKILGGYQEVRSANAFVAAGSLCNLLFLILLVHLHAGLAALVAASAGALVLANLTCLGWIWCAHKPWLLPRVRHLRYGAARTMLKSGGEFFILQIAGLVVFNSDNLVVVHYLGPVEVSAYSVAWKLTGFAMIAQTLLMPALWPAFSEAFTRGDLGWVRQAFWRTMWLTMAVATGCAILFVFAGRWLIGVWAGKAAVPTESLILLMCLWVLISTFMGNTATVLVAKGRTKLLAWCSLLAAGLNLALSIYWVQRIGALGVILGTIVSYLAVLTPVQTWACFNSLKERG
ncbi:MAG TPA: lipopolysaccharide biosynthesis protein [Bryocella sp.]|nr:lipopolysaccharide biosynthesis protein [Bryocella sp.]